MAIEWNEWVESYRRQPMSEEAASRVHLKPEKNMNVRFVVRIYELLGNKEAQASLDTGLKGIFNKRGRNVISTSGLGEFLNYFFSAQGL